MKQPAPNVIIAGKYHLGSPLARGGMGSVWVARHIQLDVDVAIKFMDVELASTHEARARFEREAKAAAVLQSPYVVDVHDYGVDDDLPYLVMRLLKGEDLHERLRRRGRLSLEEVMSILTQAAKGLRRAHELGVVHRDLKPGNLFLASAHGEETVKILDFGIAKQTGPFGSPSSATTSRRLLGSPHYMSPEQIRGAKDIDHRSDLWSLGVVLFQCVTGALPFPGDVLIDVLNRVTTGALPLATKITPELPASIDGFFTRALTHDRDRRFQSASEMTTAFADVVSAARATDRSRSLGQGAGPAPIPATTPSRIRLRSGAGDEDDQTSSISATLPLRPAGPEMPTALSPLVAAEHPGSPKRAGSAGLPKPAGSTPGRLHAPSAARAKIMIIDDDEHYCALAKRWLIRAGFEVVIQTRPFGTLNALVKGRFDLLVLDVQMPAIGGPALIKLIRDTEGLEDTKILLCSMLPKDALRQVAEQAAVRAFIIKTSSESEFIDAVTEALAVSS